MFLCCSMLTTKHRMLDAATSYPKQTHLLRREVSTKFIFDVLRFCCDTNISAEHSQILLQVAWDCLMHVRINRRETRSVEEFWQHYRDRIVHFHTKLGARIITDFTQHILTSIVKVYQAMTYMYTNPPEITHKRVYLRVERPFTKLPPLDSAVVSIEIERELLSDDVGRMKAIRKEKSNVVCVIIVKIWNAMKN